MVKNAVWILLLIPILFSCQERPTFPIEPRIELNEFYFQAFDNGTGGFNNGDTLVIKLQFEDGDGDLGLDANQVQEPYHILTVQTYSNGDTIRYGEPAAPDEYNCVDFEIIRKESSVNGSLVVTADTIYVERNPDHFNFFLTILVKEADGSFREFDTATELNCAAEFNGRFFVLNTARDVRPLTGELQYSVLSIVGFGTYFRNQTIKLRIQIQDQALHKSNVIETDEFIISEIIRPAPGS